MIVAIVPDRFKESFDKNVAEAKKDRAFGNRDVRRPTRGLQLKEDTYATMRVVLGNGQTLPLVNAGSRFGTQGDDGKLYSKDYSNFLIQQVNEDRMEKSQIVETFGEAFLFLFGERPRVLNVQGVLLNTFDFNWEAEWWWNYDHYLRGTKCVEHDARVYLTYDDVMVSGYILGASAVKSAQERNHVPLSFQFFVTDYTNLSSIGDPSADQRKIPPVASELDFRMFQPMALTKDGYAQAMLKAGSSMSLVEAYALTAVSEVRSTWSRVSELVNNAVSSVDAMLGNPVRIPAGFAGALVFDDPAVSLDTNSSGLAGKTVIRYGLFGENADEFVGGSSPYASAALDIGDAMVSSFSGVSDFEKAAELAEAAKAKWLSYGLVPTPVMVAKITALASQTGIGMQVIGSTREAVRGGSQLASTALSAGDAGVAGFTQLGTDVALLDSTAGDIDRALSAQGVGFDLSGLKSSSE